MSSWTYVHGMAEIDVSAGTNAEAIFKAQTIVSHLPRITGSEGPARWTVVPITDWPIGVPNGTSWTTDRTSAFASVGELTTSKRRPEFC